MFVYGFFGAGYGGEKKMKPKNETEQYYMQVHKKIYPGSYSTKKRTL